MERLPRQTGEGILFRAAGYGVDLLRHLRLRYVDFDPDKTNFQRDAAAMTAPRPLMVRDLQHRPPRKTNGGQRCKSRTPKGQRSVVAAFRVLSFSLAVSEEVDGLSPEFYFLTSSAKRAFFSKKKLGSKSCI